MAYYPLGVIHLKSCLSGFPFTHNFANHHPSSVTMRFFRRMEWLWIIIGLARKLNLQIFFWWLGTLFSRIDPWSHCSKQPVRESGLRPRLQELAGGRHLRLPQGDEGGQWLQIVCRWVSVFCWFCSLMSSLTVCWKHCPVTFSNGSTRLERVTAKNLTSTILPAF